MPFAIVHEYPQILLLSISYLINVPLGYIRESCPRFSIAWFFWIHASIPLIIYLRVSWGTSLWLIPATIFWAVLGQLTGGRVRRKMHSVEDTERIKHILPQSKPAEDVLGGKVAVVLLNMGGPRTNSDVKDFQRRLFSDPILIRFPLSFLFQRLFARLLVALRGRAAQKRYRLIGGGSPIYEATQRQAKALAGELNKRGIEADVFFSFNYSPPFPEEVIGVIKETGIKHILPLSLYPHYSKATTGSSLYYLRKAVRALCPGLKFLEDVPYHLHDGYIHALTDRILEQITTEEGESLDDFYLVFSAHSLPLYFVKEGDPYPFEISQTVAKILSRLKRDKNWVISYQSAVGPVQWLKPSTGDILEALARRGLRKILVVPVSFVTDHIETLWEIDTEYRRLAGAWGVEDFRMSRAVECHPGFIQALADSVEASSVHCQKNFLIKF
jgi:ferrochelatase